jgi:hypothetical protein
VIVLALKWWFLKSNEGLSVQVMMADIALLNVSDKSTLLMRHSNMRSNQATSMVGLLIWELLHHVPNGVLDDSGVVLALSYRLLDILTPLRLRLNVLNVAQELWLQGTIIGLIRPRGSANDT